MFVEQFCHQHDVGNIFRRNFAIDAALTMLASTLLVTVTNIDVERTQGLDRKCNFHAITV